MKKLCILSCVAAIASLCTADEAPAKPGFWKRAWGTTKDGAGSVWDATKGIGKKTADIVAAPFGKKDVKETAGGTAWRNLAMSMKLDPAKVRLSETHVIEATVSLVNNGKTAVQLEFPNSLRVDMIVKDERGKVVSQWSDDQRIEKEPGILVINPKERLEYSAKISTREMTAGRAFEIEAYFPSYERLRTSRTVVPER